MKRNQPYKAGSQTLTRDDWKRKFYICDRKRCNVCSKDCHHTADPEHALYKIPEPWRKWEVYDSGMFEVPR